MTTRQATDFTATGFEPEPESSWRPVDLTSFLDGTYVPPAPGVLFRTDGVGLLYSARVHSFHGESESGKSWVAQISAVDVLAEGGRVLYLDFESTPDEVVRRLLLLGAAPDAVAERFVYVQPDVSSDREPTSFAELLASRYELAVIDGVTEALGLYAASSVDADDVTAWGRRLPRRIARETGAAVVLVDHVTKSEDGRGRFAFGSQAKLSVLDGPAFTIEPKEYLAPGKVGLLVMRVGKDRAGQVRKNSGAYRASDRTQESARIRFDATDARLIRYSVEPPASAVHPDTREAAFRPTSLMQRVSRFVAENPGMSKTDITGAVSGNKQALGIAVDVLAAEGYIAGTDYIARGKAGKRYRHIRPYEESQDPLSDRFEGSSEASDWVPPLKGGGTQEPSRSNPPLTGFRNSVRNPVELSSDQVKREEPGGRPGSQNQDQEPSRNLVGEPRSKSDQQNDLYSAPPANVTPLHKPTCARCRRPTDQPVTGLCHACAYPNGDGTDDEDGPA